jgi:1-acyl-sn-glycerol-3-phosphate acyltransferase
VLSDGADENSRASFAQVLTAARATSVPVFPVALGYANEDQTLKARLNELARATGGRLIESAGPDELQASYAEIVELLRSSYLLGYYPTPATERAAGPARGTHASQAEALGLRWHEVSVVLRRPNFRALVRPGYYR